MSSDNTSLPDYASAQDSGSQDANHPALVVVPDSGSLASSGNTATPTREVEITVASSPQTIAPQGSQPTVQMI